MDTISIAQNIHSKIDALDILKDRLPILAKDKATDACEYEKKLAVTIMALRNGRKFELGGEVIVDPPTTLIEKIAKGLCHAEKLKMDMSELAYKNALEIIGLTESQLNGFQSINRYMQ